MGIYLVAWMAFAVLMLLALPFASTRKLVLEVCAWGVRLLIVGLLVGGMVVFYRPDLMPPQALDIVAASPELSNILPTPTSPYFPICAASLAAVLLLPFLAIFDVTRRLAARLCAPATVVSEAPSAAYPAVRRPDRRAAADTMARVGSRRPFRVSDHS